MPQSWPKSLEPHRLDALAGVKPARAAVTAALHNCDLQGEAAALSAAACRDSLRLVAAAADYRPPSGRWSSKFVALRQLLDEHATAGLVLAQAARCAQHEGDRRAALVELVELLADLHFYLEQLERRHNGVSI